MPDLSPEAKERARQTIRVADVFAGHADEIESAVGSVPPGHVLVAVVDAGHEFTGLHHVHTDELIDRIAELEGPGGWAMVFSPGADAETVRRRTGEMATIAEQRIAAIDRINARRDGHGS
jgi:hypothetical protein